MKKTIDLSDFREKVPNFGRLLHQNMRDEEFLVDNYFGWNVHRAEIKCDEDSENITEFRLISVNGIEQCRAEKIQDTENEISYWRFEFLGRDIGYSPDPFEPDIEKFLKYYYVDLRHDNDTFKKEISLPIVFYELSSNNNNKLKIIRYSLAVSKLYTKPLFFVSITDDGYLKSLSDWQTDDMKNIAFPTPDHYNYLFQKFSKVPNKSLYKIENISSAVQKTLVFRGFRDYEVKCLCDEVVEERLRSYGFFVDELRNIITEPGTILKYLPTVNFHLIKPCNMKCRHCFSDFSELNNKDRLDIDSAKQIIQQISEIKSFRKLNFSGGEPTMFKGIEGLVRFAKEMGIKETSMVTNGFNLVMNNELFNALIGHLDMLAFSIDSFDESSNLKIGRHVYGKTLSIIDFIQLSKRCEENNVKIKINTVVSKNNYDKVLANDIVKLKPIRWKILRMLPVENQNDSANDILPTDDEFNEFLRLNKSIAEKSNIEVVSEDNSEMTGSYLMISPDGKFFNNVDGVHKYSDPILEVSIEEALSQTSLCREIFYRRKGDYSCS